MTQEEYGKAYIEARDVLYRRGKVVGKPQVTATGRLCPIDGNPLSDLGLFREAWGEALAHELTINTYVSIIAEAVLPNCCDKLWKECLAAKRELLGSIKQRRSTPGRLGKKSENAGCATGARRHAPRVLNGGSRYDPDPTIALRASCHSCGIAPISR